MDTFAIGDVLICHTDRTSKTCVIWVVRRAGGGGGGPLEALVFDCLTEENARALYRKFHEVSKRSKLERHRRRKSDGGSIITRAAGVASGGLNLNDVFSRPPPPLPANIITTSSSSSTTSTKPALHLLSNSDGRSIRGGGSSSSNNGGGVSINHVDTSPTLSSALPHAGKWSLVQHTDRNGVTHIEVEATTASSSLSSSSSSHLVKRNNNAATNNENYGTGAILASSPLNSLANSGFASSTPSKFTALSSNVASNGSGGNRWTSKTEKSKFAKELETILSTELRRRGGGGGGEVANENGATSGSNSHNVSINGHERAEGEQPDGSGKKQAANSTGIGARSPVAYGGGGGRILRSAVHGESQSLRQRTPAMLLRKLDEFEEKAHRIWAKAEAEEENRKIWSANNSGKSGGGGSSSLIGISTPLPRGPQLDPPLKNPLLVTTAVPPQSKDESRLGHQSQPTTPVVVKKVEHSSSGGVLNGNSNNSNTRILIPTKTGREPPKKLYPKESPPIFSAAAAPGTGSRFLPVVGVSGSQMGLITPGLHHQPHSLPLYPLQLGWSRYPPTATAASGDVVAAPMSQLDVWKYTAAVQDSWRSSAIVVPGGVVSGSAGANTIGIVAAERSRSRDRTRGNGGSGGNLDLEHRRRAQSKSPARRPTLSSRMGDDVAGIGRMFRDFGDAVRSRMGGSGGGGGRGGSSSQQQRGSGGGGDVRLLSDQGAGEGPTGGGLKSNLKKQRGSDNTSGGGGASRKSLSIIDATDGPTSSLLSSTGGGGGGGNNCGPDNKKVHFNKFATVQMMG
jgi:hypothetical protein